MIGNVAKRVILARRPGPQAVPEDFRVETGTIPDPGQGQFTVRVIWLSLDPYMRGRMNAAASYVDPVEIGAVMTGEAVGEVIDSRHSGFAVGDIVSGMFGWCSHAVSDGTMVRRLDPAAAPVSTALGVLGMPGLTAWVALNDIARAEPGETIVVSAATGAVGALLGQLARRKGLRVIGVAGGEEKCAYAVAELGYEFCFDHRAGDAEELARQIAEAAPEKVQIYHDNVGGKTLEAVLPNMDQHGRIVVCGMIAWYNGEGIKEALPLPAMWRNILVKRLRVEGMIIFDHFSRYPAFTGEVAPLLRDGSVSYRESIAEGLDAAPETFLAMLSGGNFGKQLVRVGPDPD